MLLIYELEICENWLGSSSAQEVTCHHSVVFRWQLGWAGGSRRLYLHIRALAEGQKARLSWAFPPLFRVCSCVLSSSVVRLLISGLRAPRGIFQETKKVEATGLLRAESVN